MSMVSRYIAIKYMCEILCMLTLSRREIKANNEFNAIYINTVDIQEKKYAILDYTCLFIMSLSIHLQNIIDLMVLMSIQSIQSNYNVNPNTKYSNCIELRIKCLNYNRI